VKKSIRLIIAGASLGILIGTFFIVKALVSKEAVYTPYEDTNIYHVKARYNELESMVFDREDGVRVEFSSTRETVDGRDKVNWQIDTPKVSYEIKSGTIEDISFAMSNVYSDQVIEENPEDLSIYGLDDPTSKAELTFIDGEIVELFIGNKTPTKTAYYMRKEGDSTVYTLRNYIIERMHTDLTTLRSFYIDLPNLREDLRYFKIVKDRTIEIVPKMDGDDFAGSTLAMFRVNLPYRTPKYVDGQRFGEILETLPGQVKIEKYIEDGVTDFSQYGLSPPRYEWAVKDSNISVHLLFGDDVDDRYMYAMIKGSSTVFTVLQSTYSFLEVKPFELVDKFVLIPNIDTVDKFVITGREKTYTAELKREKNLSAKEGETEDVIETFFLNGKEIEDSPFRKFYQSAIGLLADAENPSPAPIRKADVSIVYSMNEGPEPTLRADFTLFNRDFHAAYRYGITEFLVASHLIDEMFDTAEALLAE
jgi:hypothetical protein